MIEIYLLVAVGVVFALLGFGEMLHERRRRRRIARAHQPRPFDRRRLGL